MPENRPFLVFLQSENDSATGTFFPIGTEFYNVIGLRYHWQNVPVPGHHGKKISEREFYTHTPGNNSYLVNYHVVSLGDTSPPPGLEATENRAFEANLLQNHPDYSFYTSEKNDGHENLFCKNGDYNPDEARPPTGREVWRRWQFVYTGNARVPCWIVRVPKEIIWEHGGLWSDNSAAVVGIAPDRLPTPAVAGIPTPIVPPAPVAMVAAAITTGAVAIAAIIMAALTVGAVEGITAGGSIQEVSSLGTRRESIVPSNVLPCAVVLEINLQRSPSNGPMMVISSSQPRM